MMKAVSKLRGRDVFAVACAISIFGLGFSLRDASAQQDASTFRGASTVKTSASGKVKIRRDAEIRMGPRVSGLRNLPILPPITVDYRDDDAGLDEATVNSRIIRTGPGAVASSASESDPGVAVATGEVCRSDAECNDCDPCTFDDCGTHTCTGGDRDGFSCDPDNNTCEGKCIGGINIDCDGGTCDLITSLCVGGNNPDDPCTPNACFSDAGCCGDEGVGGLITNGTCNLFTCDPLFLPDPLNGVCINALIPSDLPVQGAECDDGLECNGLETCAAGLCVAAADLCDSTTTVCNEADNTCLPPCVNDAECEVEGGCDVDVCDAKTCVGGFRDGFACRTDSNDASFGCDEPPFGDNDVDRDGTCSGGGSGECTTVPGECGPGATECNPGFCVGDGMFADNPCASDVNCGADGCGCAVGRCCLPDLSCESKTFTSCEELGGVFFATDDACRTIGDGDTQNICPIYGVGVTSDGTLTTAVGPVLSNNPQNCPGSLLSVGDDYAADAAAGAWIEIQIVRFIASVQVQSRLTIQFWDVTQNPPILIEDVFFNGSPGAGGPAVRTLIFDPPLPVPASGVVALANAEDFTPLGASSFLAVSDAPAIGSSNPNDLWVNGALLTNGMLGVCDGGTRDGQWCDTGGVLALCPGGSCTDVPDTLAVEIVAAVGGDPSGGCCDSVTGACVEKLPWVCKDEGSNFQGAGTFCKACKNDPFAQCSVDSDCPACTGDINTEGDPCVDDDDCGDGLCIATATCSPVPPACAAQGCCSATDVGVIPVCSSTSTNAGFHCPNGDTDCDGIGGACSDNADVVDGNCVSVRGGCATLVDGNSVPCSQDTDCSTLGLGTCLNNACPAGTNTNGFGTSCAPSICVQPQTKDCPDGICDAGTNLCVGGDRDGFACLKFSGGDNCFDAPVTIAPVPPLQSPPVARTTTVTGNNAEATFDDFNEGVCNGGDNDGADCDPNVVDPDDQCLPDGTCDRLCGLGLLNPAGGTADPGWWEAFSISECANVRLSTCGSALVVRPAWAFLSTGCPCGTTLGNDGVLPPVGTGLGTAGGARGGPFCSLSDNFWQTFATLPPGKYYYPIFSAPNGTCAAPIANSDSAGCTYQFQITTGACSVAACCADAVCTGGDNAGLPCATDRCTNGTNDGTPCLSDGDCAGGGTCVAGLALCPDGECINGTCDAGIMVGHACTGLAVDQCTGGACDPGPACTTANQLQCDAAGGFWAGELNLPEMLCSGGDFAGNACETDLDCAPADGGPAGPCVLAPLIIACSGADLGVCEFGACCNGPGECGTSDDQGELVLVDRQECAIATQNQGTFVAGSRCSFPDPPCPVCTAAETPGNCQEAGGSGFFTSIDRVNVGAVVADDFVAVTPEIGQFCFSPCYRRVNSGAACFQDNVRPPNKFLVRFLEDGGDDLNPLTDPGFPGDLLPGSPPGPEFVEIAAERIIDGLVCVLMSVVFDPPITGFVLGRTYWVEFSAEGEVRDDGNGCAPGIIQSLEGNGWNMADPDDFGVEEFGSRVWNINDARLAADGTQNDWTASDFIFCIEGGLTVPPPMTGACCKCNGDCEDDVLVEGCLQRFLTGTGGDSVSSTVGDYFPRQTCAEIECMDVGAGGGCPGELGEVAEDCGNPLCIAPAGTLCADGLPPEIETDIFEVEKFDFSLLCSSTDGPEQVSGGNCANTPTGADQWIEYHAPVKGRVNFDVCGGMVDLVTVAHTNGTSTCPNDPVNGQCPPAGTPVFCDDAECRRGIGEPTGTIFAKNTCLGGANDGIECEFFDICLGGANNELPCSSDADCPGGVCQNVECPGGSCQGECILFRLAGFATSVGPGQFEIETVPSNCPISNPPNQDTVLSEALTMNRSLAVSAGDAGVSQAIRVRIDSVGLLPNLQHLVGSEWWVQPRTARSEKGDTILPVAGSPNFLVAELGCDPFFTDWNGVCVDGACEGGLRDGLCVNSICANGPSEGNACVNDSDCPGEGCVDTADCGGAIINIVGEMIVPGASYTVSVVGENCDLSNPENFADSSLKMFTSSYGDTVGQCLAGVGCAVPDGGPNVFAAIADALAGLGGFTGDPNAPRKMRMDLEPSVVDFKINISDILQNVNGFTGSGCGLNCVDLQYPFLSCRPTFQGLKCFGGSNNGGDCTTSSDCELDVCPPMAVRGNIASSR